MQLTGKQIAQICDALVEAFSKDTLRRLVRIELDQRLEAIADGENLSVMVFNLVSWAEQHGRIEDLIQGACRANGGNLQLRRLHQDLLVWSTTKLLLPHVFQGHTAGVNSVAFSPDGSTLASGGNDETIRLWDVQTGKQLRVLKMYSGCVYSSVAFSPDGLTIASGSSRSQPAKSYDEEWFDTSHNIVRLWDVQTGQHLRAQKYSRHVHSVVFSPDGRVLGVATGTLFLQNWDWVHLLDVQRWVHRSTLTRDPVPWENLPWSSSSIVAYSVAFSPDGLLVAAGFGALLSSKRDEIVALWNVQSGKLLRELVGHANSVASVAFSPDGRTLASGSRDHTVRLWDVHTGSQLHTLEGHTDGVESVAFSPDGRTLVSGSQDYTVRLWDVRTGKLLRTLEGHTDSVYSVAFSPNGRVLASASSDKTVRLWPVER